MRGVFLTDEKDRAVQEYEYDSFGNMKNQKNRIKQPYAFTGREWDREAKLYFYRARYYDAGAGRFVSFDPILRGVSGFNETTCRQSVAEIAGKMPKEMNPFSYTENNPVNMIDPMGLEGCGPGDGWLEKIIPEFIFGGCCDDHDDCYDCKGKDAGKTKFDCDRDFCACLTRRCLFSSIVPCPAGTYCLFAVLFGGNSFNNARECCI